MVIVTSLGKQYFSWLLRLRIMIAAWVRNPVIWFCEYRRNAGAVFADLLHT